MAISRERLEELIKEGATIYWVINNTIKELPYKDIPTFWIKDIYNYFDRLLFETKEDAEWFLEFGNITRTEKLELPSWEEFWNSGKTIWFIGKDGGQYAISQYSRGILLNDEYIGYLNKESYIKACHIAKKLFIGDERDE